MVGELLLLAAVSLAAGFGLGWTLRAALARADRVFPEEFDRYPPTMILEPEEIVPLVNAQVKYTDNVESYVRGMREYFKDRGGRS